MNFQFGDGTYNPVAPFDRNLINEANISSIPAATESKRLKTIGITLLVVGLLLIVMGIALASALSNPLLIPIAAMGLILMVPAGISLIRAKRQRELLATPQESLPGPRSISSEPRPPFQREEVERREDFSKKAYSTGLTKVYFNKRMNQIFQGTVPLTEQSYGKLTKKNFCNNKGFRLVFARGDICELRHTPPGSIPKTLIVNAANPNVASGGSGTNRAISEITDPKAWNKTKPQRPLQPGEFTIGKWDPSNIFQTKYPTTRNWNYLCQFLGPTAEQCNNTAENLYVTLLHGFTNLFEQCITQGINLVQMPLISCGIYGPSDPGLKKLWVQTTCTAILDAVSCHEDKITHDKPFSVVIVDLNGVPLDD